MEREKALKASNLLYEIESIEDYIDMVDKLSEQYDFKEMYDLNENVLNVIREFLKKKQKELDDL